MADISSVVLLDGNSYDLKDSTARTLLGGHSVGVDVPSDAVFTDTGMYIASYGSSTYAQVLAAYQDNRIIYCRASTNASNPASGNQLRMAFLAYVNNQTTPTEFEFQYYRSVATHSDSAQGDEVYIYKLKQASGWEFTKRNAFTKIAVGTGLGSSYSSETLTLNNSGVRSITAGSTNGSFSVNTGGTTSTITIADATTGASGLMSATDKTTLDSLSASTIPIVTVASSAPSSPTSGDVWFVIE